MKAKSHCVISSFLQSAQFIFITVAAFHLFGCSSPVTHTDIAATPVIIESLGRYTRDYTLQAGDKVEVFVYRQPEFSKTVTIRPDGYLTLPVLDDIKAAGLTPMELDSYVTQALSVRLKEPEVSVFVENIVEPMIYVHGEVQIASAIPLRKAKTVAQALAQAGGIKRAAEVSQVAVIRLQNDGHLRAIAIDDSGFGQASNFLAMQNIQLLPEDIIFVPESYRSQFVRGIEDFVNTPLNGINQLLSPYFQFRIIDEIENANDAQTVSLTVE